MSDLQIYRKRIIPEECILLKDDEIIEEGPDHIITRWKTLHPKKDFDHGTSCYFFEEGIKVSKFYRSDNTLLYWYCDIVSYQMDKSANCLYVTDLLADVIIYPSGQYKVLDLDELAEAFEKELISKEQMNACLRQLNNLLQIIDRDKFEKFQSCLDFKGL